MEVRRPTDVLDQQVALLRWWASSPYAQIVADSFVDTATAQGNSFGVPTGMLPAYMADRLNRSESIFVTSHIVNRLWGFAKRYETAHLLSRDDLPCERGYVWLQTPVYVYDVRGRICPIRVISWSAEANGVWLSEFNDIKDELDELGQQLRQKYPSVEPRTPLFHWDMWRYGTRTLANIPESELKFADPISDEEWKRRGQIITPPTPESIVFAKKDAICMAQFILSLWEHMQEQLPGRMFPDRAGKRRLMRTSLIASDVKIVDLRTVSSNHSRSENPQEVIWTHRWKVREHKRRWIDKHGQYRETTVSAHLRGPEHLPYIEKDSVYNVRR